MPTDKLGEFRDYNVFGSVPSDYILEAPSCGYFGSFTLVQNNYNYIREILLYPYLLPDEDHTVAIFRIYTKCPWPKK